MEPFTSSHIVIFLQLFFIFLEISVKLYLFFLLLTTGDTRERFQNLSDTVSSNIFQINNNSKYW